MAVFEEDYSGAHIFGPVLSENFKKHCHKFQENIFCVSPSFISAKKKAQKSLLDLLDDILRNDSGDLDISGTFICGDNIHMIDYHAKKGVEMDNLVYFLFSKQGAPIIHECRGVGSFTWISNASPTEYKSTPEKIIEFVNTFIGDIIITALFKSYASIETVFLQPNTNKKEINCKYSNGTNSAITFLDSKWFSNLVQSEGFKVSGHFRLQPKIKDGKWTKDLIWINEFKKHGYTSKAKILNQI